MIDRRRFVELTWDAFGVVALWLAAGVFSTSEFYRRAVLIGGEPHWFHVWLFQTASSFVWAFTTPLVIAIAERVPHKQNRAAGPANRVCWGRCRLRR